MQLRLREYESNKKPNKEGNNNKGRQQQTKETTTVQLQRRVKKISDLAATMAVYFLTNKLNPFYRGVGSYLTNTQYRSLTQNTIRTESTS